MKLNKKLFGRSLYKIATILFLVGYNFAPAAFAIGDISKLEGDTNQSVSVTTEETSEETSEVVNQVPVDTSEDIHEKGISDPASIAEGEELPSKEALPFRTDVLQKAVLNSRGQYTISSTSGIWTGVTPSGVASGLNTNIIRWGNSTGDGQSGLKFTSAGSQSFSPNDVFLIGDLTHMNWPVSGDVPNSATLKVTLNFTNPLLTPSPTFSYGFNIKETPNNPRIPWWELESNRYKYCPGYPEEQLSEIPCDDVITFPNAYGDKVFTIDDTKYTLKIDGFQNAYPEGSSVSKFVTEERKNNKAYLVGHLSSVLVERPDITITKRVNGEDANTAPGIYVGEGDSVEFEYRVQNTGNVRLTNIFVADDKGVNVSCPQTSLEAGASMTCTSTGEYKAILGLYTNIGTVFGTHSGVTVSASDPANYTGVKKVDICHATASQSNPYVGAKASMTADAGGHDGHNGPVWYPGITVTWGDIIPPFDYSGGHYPGKNWDAYGQSVLANGCTVPTGTLKVNKVTIPSTDTTSFNITGTGTPAASGAPTFHNGNTGTISHGNPHTYTVSPGTYSVSETVPTGWKEVGNTCNDIVIANGEDKECTITNTKYGSITIVKDARPSSDEIFRFTTGAGLFNFTLVDNLDDSNPSKVFDNLLPGTYSVSETEPDGWDLTSATCTDGSPVTAINLSAGEDITCTFVNEKRGSISGHKFHDLDGKAGTTDDRHPVSGWTIFIDKDGNGKLNEGEDFRITGADGKYSFANLKPGTYKIVELMKAGWIELTGITREITIAPGENRENVDFVNIEYPTIQVIKNVDANGDGTVDVTNVKDWKWKIGSDEYDTGREPVPVMPGNYDISELQKTGYHVTSLVCTNGETTIINTPSEHVNITLQSGDKVVCTFTNTRNTGTLIVKKVVVNDNGGNLEAKDFSFKIDGGTPIQFEEDGQNEFTKYAGLSYSITEVEADERGYTTTYENCTGVTVPYNDTAICTITNTDVAPQLTVIKHVDNEGNDGTKSAGDFAITVTGTNVSTSNFQGSEDGVTVTLNQGSFSVTEEEDTENYTATYEGCSGTINIGEKKTCTITNTGKDHKPTIEVTKEADKTSVDETGENVTFTFTVENTSKVDTVEILSLIDSVFGDLNGEHACKVGTTLAPNTTCTFTITRLIEGDASGDDHYNKFTAEVKDEEGNETSDDDDETVTLRM